MIFGAFVVRGLAVLLFAMVAFVVAVTPLARAAWNGEQSEPSTEVHLPAPPQLGALIPLYVAPNSANRFFVDGPSLSVGSGGTIRYTMVVESSTGAKTVNFEGIHCSDWLRIVYAFWQADGTWRRARNPMWSPIGGSGPNGYQYVLYRYYFCPEGVPVRDASEAVTALRRGPQTAVSPMR